jgi:hypothetical protein
MKNLCAMLEKILLCIVYREIVFRSLDHSCALRIRPTRDNIEKIPEKMSFLRQLISAC